VSTALITTCFREAGEIAAFLDAALAQTRQPDAIVIVDAGSTDGTVERIRERIATGASITLLVEPGASRSRGRNLAIEASAADLIAVTDVGALPRPDWFARIIAPLEADPPADVSAGYYVAEPRTLWQAAVAAATVPTEAEVDPATFLPSARSVAFGRTAWQAAGGYPEWARHNEDTPFDLALKATGARFVFTPDAIVGWLPQASVRRLFVQFMRYARGDSQSGIWFRHYTKAYGLAVLTLGLVVAGLLWPSALAGLAALLAGYWTRHALRARHRTHCPAAAFLAPAANLVVDAAHVVGYTWGRLERRRGRRAGAPRALA
jgi:glycosyltransferase involved in cell wall biosynthesis